MTVKITKAVRHDNVIPLRDSNTHQVHLDASQLVSQGIRAICLCGTVAEPLRGAQEVVEFLKHHRSDVV